MTRPPGFLLALWLWLVGSIAWRYREIEPVTPWLVRLARKHEAPTWPLALASSAE